MAKPQSASSELVKAVNPMPQAKVEAKGGLWMSEAAGVTHLSMGSVDGRSVGPWEAVGADVMSTAGWDRSGRGERVSNSDRLRVSPGGVI